MLSNHPDYHDRIIVIAGSSTGRLLIVLGAALLAIGLAVEYFPWFRLGRLPGDFWFGSGNVRVYVPLTSSLVVSLLLTLLLSLIARR